MKVLLLGSGGFVGKSIMQRFDFLTKSTDLAIELVCPRSFDLDLSDQVAVDSFFSHQTYDYVIFAAVDISKVEKSISMFLNVYKNFRHYGYLFNIGSGAEYGPYRYNSKMKEEYFSEAFPSSGYPLIKYVQGSVIENGIVNNAVNLRVFGIYGPEEDSSRRFISNNILKALNGEEMTCRKDMFFDYVYVDDLCDFIWASIQEKYRFKYRTYNFTPKYSMLLSEIGEQLVNQIQGSRFRVLEEGNNGEYSGDSSRLTSEFGNVVKTDINQGIRNLVEFFKSKLDKV